MSSGGALLLVVTAEQVDVIIVLGSGLGSLGGVDGQLVDLRAIGLVALGGITRESSELALVGGNVAVPPGGVGVLGGIRGRAQSLEGDDISLGRRIAVARELAHVG